MSEVLVEQLKSEEFRTLVEMSLKYWKPRIAGYEAWKDFKTRSVTRLHAADLREGEYYRVLVRQDLLEQSKRLPTELRRLYEITAWKCLRRLKQGDTPVRDLSERALRESYVKKTAQIAEMEAAVVSRDAWSDYVDILVKRFDAVTGCVAGCVLICVSAIVVYYVYKCWKEWICPPPPVSPPPTPPPTQPPAPPQQECEEVEVCDEVPVEVEEEVCEEECPEDCEEQ